MVYGTSPRLRDQNRTELEEREREETVILKARAEGDGNGWGAHDPLTRDKENTKSALHACIKLLHHHHLSFSTPPSSSPCSHCNKAFVSPPTFAFSSFIYIPTFTFFTTLSFVSISPLFSLFFFSFLSCCPLPLKITAWFGLFQF